MKQQEKMLSLVSTLCANGLYASAARTLSAMLRASLNDAATSRLIDFAAENIGLLNSPDFIVSDGTRAKIIERGDELNQEALEDAYEERVRMSYQARGYHNIY